jgi:hypothetical protein
VPASNPGRHSRPYENMGKKPKKSKDSAQPRGWRRAGRRVVVLALTLAVATAVLFGLRSLGDEALRGLGPRERFRVRFADVQCDSPPGTDRSTFLTEVRYTSGFPETFNALDPADRDRLSAAFASHPWVESVDDVSVEPQTVVRVKLTFRTPLMKVLVEGGGVRIVDRRGVLLPEMSAPSAVSELLTRVPAPTTPAGQVWADDTVRRAVDLVKTYQPLRLEQLPSGWRLTRPDGKTLHVER